MQLQIIAHFFREQVWTKSLPKQIVTPSITFNLGEKDIQYLVDDQTNPNLELFSINQQIEKAIKKLRGVVFMKCASRSPKDISPIDRKIKSTRDLVMTIKMSDYLTQGLCQQLQGCQLVLRQFRQQFEDESNQFRVYVIQGKVMGICQKLPTFIAEDITINQIERISQIASIICKQLTSPMNQLKQTEVADEFVFDIYCQQNGKKALIISIQPFHIHALSLFTQAQLRSRWQGQKSKTLVKLVKKESQLKQINLSQYRSGAELKNYQNLKEWIHFVQQQKQAI